MSPSTSSPVSGMMGICPEVYRVSLATMAWELLRVLYQWKLLCSWYLPPLMPDESGCDFSYSAIVPQLAPLFHCNSANLAICFIASQKHAVPKGNSDHFSLSLLPQPLFPEQPLQPQPQPPFLISLCFFRITKNAYKTIKRTITIPAIISLSFLSPQRVFQSDTPAASQPRRSPAETALLSAPISNRPSLF